MRSSPLALGVALLAALVIGSTPGCGGKKRSPLTIAQRLDRARSEPSDEAKARELTKVARLQVRSMDRSGAVKTLSEARALLTPKAPRPPRTNVGTNEAGTQPDAETQADAGAAEPAADDAPPAVPDAAEPEAAEPEAAEPDAAVPDAAESEGAEPATDAAAAADPVEPDAMPPDAAEPDAEDVGATPPDDTADAPPPSDPVRTVNPVLAGPILVEIARLYAEIGERDTARGVLSQVVGIAPQIDDLVVKATMLAQAGGIYGAKTGGVGEAVKARRVLGEAATLTESIEERFRPQALAEVALGYVDAGLTKDAAEQVGSLESLARSAADRPKAEGLAVAARVRAQAGDKEAAKALLDEAAATAKGIVGHENRAYALVSVATATAAAGDRKAALALLAEAEKSANKVGDPEAQKDALERVRGQRGEIDRRK